MSYCISTGSRNGRRHVGTRRAENNTRQRHNDTYLPERRISRVPQRRYQPYGSDPAPAGQCRTGTQDRKEPSKGVACHALRKPRRYEAYSAGRAAGCLGEGFLRLATKTFGKENVVSAVLHLDEKTPHIHATVVPIVRGERRKAKLERERNTAGGKRTYRTKKDRPRLCADDMMARDKLKAYQTTYAEAMAKYGLRRGIDGSEAKHISTQQFYREVKVMTDILKADIKELQKQKATTREELNRVKKEVQTERLKGLQPPPQPISPKVSVRCSAATGSRRWKGIISLCIGRQPRMKKPSKSYKPEYRSCRATTAEN